MAASPEAIRDARVEEQMQRIGAIQSAVLAARTEEALTLIQAYRAEFPSGLFLHECDVLERRALAHSE